MKPGKHPDFQKLFDICAAMERKNGKGTLPSVRRDSPMWQAWRGWFIERGLPCKWSDAQPDATMMTVATEFPPIDIDTLHKHWVKGRGDFKLPSGDDE